MLTNQSEALAHPLSCRQLRGVQKEKYTGQYTVLHGTRFHLSEKLFAGCRALDQETGSRSGTGKSVN